MSDDMASRAKDQPGGQVAPMGEWLPIETAPLDVRGLLWCADLCGESAWDERTGRWVRTPKGVVFGYVSVFRGLPRSAHGEGFNGDWTFTHWMPLPEPPQ